MNWLSKRWYSTKPAPWFLHPPATLFGVIAAARRRRQQSKALRLPIPVIVVGNIAVGGTGKTPFVIWLVQRLRESGWRPGVVSRGYRGRSTQWPRHVNANSDPAQVGDEPVLIAKRAGCPVAVGPDRVAAARLLLTSTDVDVIISDDGLQHYRLARDLEIAVVDGSRGLGNGLLLPAGPLREPPERLQEMGLIVVNGKGWTMPAGRVVTMDLFGLEARALKGGAVRPIASFTGQSVHAVAGIGNPARFFAMLSQQGIRLVMHPFPDHHSFTAADLAFDDELPVLMTEKDAVKCRAFAGDRHWVVPVEASVSARDAALVQELIRPLKKRTQHG